MKKIWTYDRLTGLQIAESQADADPMSPGEWLMPAFSTDKPPPKAGKNQVAAIVDGYWRLVADWRGVPLYAQGEAGTPVPLIDTLKTLPSDVSATDKAPPTVGAREVAIFEGLAWTVKTDWRRVQLWDCATKERKTIATIDTLPSEVGLTQTPPPEYAATFTGGEWLADMGAIEREKWEAIKAERDRRTLTGGYRVGENWFDSDTFSRTQQLGLKDRARDALAGGAEHGDELQIMNEPIAWKTMSGSFINITAGLAFEIVEAAGQSDAVLFKAAEMHRSAMLASSEPWNYNVTAEDGWPMSFSG